MLHRILQGIICLLTEVPQTGPFSPIAVWGPRTDAIGHQGLQWHCPPPAGKLVRHPAAPKPRSNCDFHVARLALVTYEGQKIDFGIISLRFGPSCDGRDESGEPPLHFNAASRSAGYCVPPN